MRDLFVRVTVVVSGFGVLAGGLLAATGQAHGPARPLVHVGRSSPVHLVRRVDVRGLPAPTHHPVISTEPRETAPVTRAPRTTGVVPLVQKKIGAPADDASEAAVERSSVAGLSLNGHMPPDTQLAVSPSRVVEFVNDSGEVLDHSGAVLKTFDLGSLFSGKANTGTDPKIVYDSSSEDFFASYISKFSDDGASTVELAVTSDPTGTWFVYDVHDEGILQDQPKLGVSSDKLTMSWNDHGNSGPEEYMVIQKAGIVAHAGSVPGTIWGPDSSRLNVVAAVQLSPSSTAYAVYHNYTSSKVGLLSFTGVPGVSTTSFTEKDFTIASTSAPPGAGQPPVGMTTSPTLDTGDDRLESTVWSNGTLWTAGNDVCRYKTDRASRSCLRVIKISTAHQALERDVDITMVGGDVMYPSVVTDTRSDVWIAFSSSSTSQFASGEVAEAPGGTIGATIGAIIYKTGTGSINIVSPACTSPPTTRNRFGDYSGVAIDPARKGLGIWTAEEFGVSGCGWGTQLGAFTP